MVGLMSFRGAGRWILLPLDRARLAVSTCFQPLCVKLRLLVISSCVWYQPSHLILGKKGTKRIFRILINAQQRSPNHWQPTGLWCCAVSSRAGGSARCQSRMTVPLLTDLKLVFSSSTEAGGRNRCKPLWKRATSSSIWSVWTECLICPHEHTVRCARPCQNTSLFLFFFPFFCIFLL